MNTTAAREVLEKIKQYDRIIIFRHFRPDGDATGSTKGLQRILQLSFPEKAEELYSKAARDAKERLNSYKKLADG